MTGRTVDIRLRDVLAAIVAAREENALPGGSRDMVETCLEDAEVELVAALEEVDRHAAR